MAYANMPAGRANVSPSVSFADSSLVRGSRWARNPLSRLRRQLSQDNFNADLFMQEIRAIEMQTLGELTNITRSMGFAYRDADGTVKVDDVGRMYQRILDDALMRVESGHTPTRN